MLLVLDPLWQNFLDLPMQKPSFERMGMFTHYWLHGNQNVLS